MPMQHDQKFQHRILLRALSLWCNLCHMWNFVWLLTETEAFRMTSPNYQICLLMKIKSWQVYRLTIMIKEASSGSVLSLKNQTQVIFTINLRNSSSLDRFILDQYFGHNSLIKARIWVIQISVIRWWNGLSLLCFEFLHIPESSWSKPHVKWAWSLRSQPAFSFLELVFWVFLCFNYILELAVVVNIIFIVFWYLQK
jgi:hypothetical protein